MKHALLFIAILFTTSFFAQTVTWNQLPPLSPGGAGTVNPEASDIVITDNGDIYASYFYDNGVDGLRLYIMKYNGSGWSLVYNDVAHDGMQTIKSRKHGDAAYFITRVGDGSGNPVWRVYTAISGSLMPYADFMLSDYSAASGFDFEMGSDPTIGYMFYKGGSSTLKLSRVDFAASSITTQPLNLPGGMVATTYDMTVAGDSLFMAAAGQSPSYNAYLFKAGPSGSVIVPYTSASADGQLLNPGPISCNTVNLNSDGIGKVHITLYDFGNMASFEKIYEDGALTGIPYIGTIAQSYVQSATYGNADMLYSFNNYSPANAYPYSSYVVSYDIATQVFDTIATPGNYVLATNAPSQHRLAYSESAKRLAVSFYDNSTFLHSYYLTNTPPYIAPGGIDAAAGMCETQSSMIFNNLSITDDNGDLVTILGVTSSDPAVLDNPNIYYISNGQSGNATNFYFYGVATQAGTVTLTIEVTDGLDTLTIELPPVNVVSPNPPSFTQPAFNICSGQGEINLFDYISQEGGNFYINSLEIDFPEGIYDTDNSPLGDGEIQTLTYDLFDGACQYSVDADITFYTSPTVSITSTPTACGLSNGTATALVTGGTTPYALSQWSSGQLNTNNVSGLSAGQHSYSITDANSCIVTNYFNILTTGANANGAVTNIACHGGTDGAIALTTTGLSAPIAALWSSGHSTLNLSGVPAGTYTVDLWDAAGCSLSKTFTITEPDALVTEVGSISPACDQADGVMEAIQTTGGEQPYTYAWSNGDTGPISSNVPFGVYSLTTTDDNGCMTINTVYMSELGGAGLPGTITPTNCGTNEGAINVTPGIPSGEAVAFILWSNGQSTEDIEDLLPAVYVCTLELTNNCTSINAWEIPVVEPLRNDICVVTVDSATTTNLVVWEPVQETGIAWYNIYRESSIQGEFVLIDTVHATNLSVFNDVVASPIARSWRYKIAAVNGCGAEGELSPAHQTIHLDVLDVSGTDVTINWNAYQGAAFSNYIVSRYTDALGTWEPIDTLPNTQISYTDNTPITTSGLDYMVEIELDEQCTAVIWRAQDFNSARSNKDKGQFSAGNGTGDSHNSVSDDYLSSIVVSPNPTNGMLNIHQAEAQKILVQIRSVEGQLMQFLATSSLHEQIDLSTYASGIYFVTLTTGEVRQTLRIVKQ
jgi:hypothetical protein